MSTHGETFNVTLPTVTITGSVSGSISVNPAVATTGTGVIGIDENRMVKHNYNHTIPVIHGTATVTITPATGTQVHYTFNGRNPSHKGVKKSTADNATVNAHVTKYKQTSLALVYSSAFTVEQSRPGSNLCVMRIRAHKLVGTKVSPNEKSKVLVIKFVLSHHLATGGTVASKKRP